MELGWEVTELASRLSNRPSAASIYRLEAGKAIRAGSVRRIFDAINIGLDGKLIATDEIKLDLKDG